MSAGPAAAHRPAVRRSPAPRVPRRVSGPARGRARTAPRPTPRPAARVATPRAAGGAVALPQPLVPRLVDVLAGLPDSRWLDRLLRGRAWIALIALALMGLVFMQVSMLKMNAGIGQSVERSAALERQNADLRASVSQLSSEERIQRAALDMGLVMPPAGDIRYLQARPDDAARAVKTMRVPAPATEQTTAAGAAAATQTATQEQTPPPTPAAQQAQAQEAAPTQSVQAGQQAAPLQTQQAAPVQPQQTAPPPQQAQTQTAPQAGAAVAPGTGQ